MAKLLVLLPLFLFAGFLVPVVSFGEAIDSPKEQLESGIAPEDITCRENDLVLVIRTSGDPACVTEKSADKMNWKIVSQSDIDSNPNLTNYWIPIAENERDEFASKFARAIGESVISINEKGEYITENGIISKDPTSYSSHNLSITNISDIENYVSNFMNSMEFEYDEEKDVSYREKDSGTHVNISKEFSYVNFSFYNPDTRGGGTLIHFGGWANNPDAIIFELSEDVAIEKALEHSKIVEQEYDADPQYKSASEQECNLKLYDSPKVSKKVVSGIPYFDIGTGYCDNGMGARDAPYRIVISIDAITGEDISGRLMGYF